MRKFVHSGLFLFLVLSFYLFAACENTVRDNEERYDLFPLKEGNEYYYKYYRHRFNGISAYTTGTEKWKVVSESSLDNSKIYRIERRLNGTVKVVNRTTIITDSIRYFNITEDLSSSLLSFTLYQNISLKRYQNNTRFEIKQVGNSVTSSWSYLFKADSGLTKYSYYHPPNQIDEELLILDSVRLEN